MEFIISMKEDIQNNYNILKKEIRKFLKRDIPLKSQVILNNQMKSIVEMLQEMNNDDFDMELQSRIEIMHKDFMPYMIGYWVLKELPQPENESPPSSV